MTSTSHQARERTKVDANRYTPNTAEWVSLNRCPSHEVERVLDSFRHAAHHSLGRPQSALLPRHEINSRRTLRHLHGLKGGWNTADDRTRELKEFSVHQRRNLPDNNRRAALPEWSTSKKYGSFGSKLNGCGGVGGGTSPSSPHSQCKEGNHAMFPGWLLREMELRQLASADPSTLEKRREEAALWIKKELGASPSVMFGDDMSWYAKSANNQQTRAASARQRRRPDGRMRQPTQEGRDGPFLRGGAGGGRSTQAATGLPRYPSSLDGKKVLTNAPPPVYRAGGGLKKGSSPTGSGWEFFVSKLVLNKTERATEAIIAMGSKSGINLLDRFDDSMVDYLSAEVLLQQAFSIRSATFGVDHPKARASGMLLLQVYDAQNGGREDEAKELRADPHAHLRTVNLRIAELERAIETFKTEGGGAFSSKRSKKNNNGGGGGEDAADVKLRLANLFKEKWALAAAERARQRIRKREFQTFAALEEDKGVKEKATRGGLHTDTNAYGVQAEEGYLSGGGPGVVSDWEMTNAATAMTAGSEAPHVWHTTARIDPEGLSATLLSASNTGFNSEEAVRRATDSLKRQDYFLAARSCMGSLEQDVRNPVAIQVLQESFRQISSFPKKEDFRADVEVALGPAASGVLGERFTVRYSYHHRDKLHHPHPAKDWVGLFLLGDELPPPPAAIASGVRPPPQAGQRQTTPVTPDKRLPYRVAPAFGEHSAARGSTPDGQQTTGRSNVGSTAENKKGGSASVVGGDGSAVDTAAVAAATASAAGSSGPALTVKVAASVASGTNPPGRHADLSTADNVNGEHASSRTQNKKISSSHQMATELATGASPRATATRSGDNSVVGKEGDRGKTLFPGKMIGWRTLPPDNAGVFEVDEGIVALEGVYVVRYFLGGSGCCVAQSKNFKVEMARVDLKIVADTPPPPITATSVSMLKLGATTSNSPTPGFLRLTCGAPFEVAYRFNYSTAVPTGDWLGVIAWGDEPTAGTCIVRRPFLESSSGAVFFEEGPPLPGKYAVHAFLTESNNAVAGSTAMFECISGFGAEEARCSRNGREFTLYLSTRWDMMLERAAFRDAAAPALKQMLDARGVTFGYIDARSDLDVEELTTPRGVDAVLDGIRRCCPYFVCCLGELNDVELGAESVNASILQENPWLKRVLLPDSSALTNSSDREKKLVRAGRMRAAAAMLTVTDLEVLSGFLLPVLQETIQAESGSCTTAGVTRARLAAVPGGAARHSCIVNALADFRRLVSQQDREGGDGHDEEVAGDGNGKPVAADTGQSSGLVTQGTVVPKRGFMTEHAFFYTRAACLRSELHPTPKMGAGGIAGAIRFINGSKGRMIKLKHELAANTTRFRQGYQDETVLVSMLLEDLSRAIDRLYPLHTAPDRLDHASLFSHASARNLLNAAVVKLPVVRYRGFRPEPSVMTGGVLASPGLAASPAASTAVTAASAAAAVAAAASAAWRLQQRLEFIPFEERVKRMSGEAQEGGDTSAAAAAHAAAADGGTAAAARVDRSLGSDGRQGTARSLGTTPAETGSEGTGDVAAGSGAAPAATPAVAAKRLAVVLADYLGDKTTIGMVVVDQPGTGLTTALLGFLEWYCRGQVAGGRKGVTVVESLDRIPQYGRCNLSRAVISRPRLVSRNLNDGGLVDETVERRTLVVRVDCRDPCHGRQDKAHLVNYLSCEIIRTFGMPYKMPDKPGLSSRPDTGIVSEQTSDNPRDHNHDDDEAAVDPQDQLAADTAAASGTKSGGGTMAAAAAATSGGKGGKEGGRTEVGPEVLRRWFDVLRGHGDLVLVIENPDALVTPDERAAASPEEAPNPLAWLPPELPPHVKVITTCSTGSSCQQLLCGAEGWGWHMLRRKAGLDADTKGQVIDAVLRKHGVGCMLDWVESDLVLKEKTANIQFLVGVTEALCYSGKLARSGLPPGLHTAASTGSRPASPSSVSSAAACRSNSGSCTSTGKGEKCDGGGGGGGGCGMSDADVARLRGAAASMMHEESAIDVARLRIRQLVSVKGHRGSLLRAALCLVRLSHAGLSVLELSAALRHILERYKSQRHQHHKPPPYTNITTSAGGAGTGGRNTGSSNKGPGNSSNVHDNTSNNGNNNNPSNNNTSSSQTTTTASAREPPAREAAAATPTARQAPVSLSPQATGSPETPPNPGASADTTKDRNNDSGLPDAPRKSVTTTDTTATTTTKRNTTTSEEAEDASMAHESSREVGGGGKTGAAAATSAAKQPPERGGKGAAALGEHGLTSSSPRAERTQRPAFGQQDWRALEPDLMQFCHKVLGRFVLRDFVTVTAVDLECLKTLDKFVVRAQQHQQPQAATAHGPLGLGHLAGAPSSSLPGSNGGVDAGPTEQRSKHFYYQVLADSFAKDLPGVRRAEEQLAALAAIVVLSTHGGVEAPRRASRPYREKLFTALADVELLYAMNGSKRGDPQAYLEYMHLAHVFAAPRRFAAAVRSTFEEYYNIVSHKAMGFHGKSHREHYQHQARAAATHDLLYTVHGLKHPVAARQPGGGGGSGGSKALGGGLSEVSKVLAARRRQKQPPPPPLTRAGALRLLEAAKLVLERLGDAEETMNLAESAWALMFGVSELTDEAFGRVMDISFPVDKIVDCLRILAGVYVSRGFDMHLLLFHEAAQTESRSDDSSSYSAGSSANPSNPSSTKPPKGTGPINSPASPNGSTRSGNAGQENGVGGAGTQSKTELGVSGTTSMGQRHSMAVEATGVSGLKLRCDTSSSSLDGSGGSSRRTAATGTGKSGRFATAGRLRDFRAMLKGAAAHASKMKTAHANRELSIEGAVRGHDVDAAVLNKSTNPGRQTKQQIGRVARAREAVDGMLTRWPLVIERMGICTEQAIKIRNLVKTAGTFPTGGLAAENTEPAAVTAAGSSSTTDARACEKRRAAKEHARVVEQHAEILALSQRFERVALAIQRRQEEREYHRLAALGLVPPGVSISELRDQLRSTTTNAAMTRAPSFFEDHHYQGR